MNQKSFYWQRDDILTIEVLNFEVTSSSIKHIWQ